LRCTTPEMSQFGCTRLTRVVTKLMEWMIYRRRWHYTERWQTMCGGAFDQARARYWRGRTKPSDDREGGASSLRPMCSKKLTLWTMPRSSRSDGPAYKKTARGDDHDCFKPSRCRNDPRMAPVLITNRSLALDFFGARVNLLARLFDPSLAFFGLPDECRPASCGIWAWISLKGLRIREVPR
jgi:hypothetical protein